MLKTIKVPVPELSGQALNWAVAQVMGVSVVEADGLCFKADHSSRYAPSTNMFDCEAVLSGHIKNLSRMGDSWLAVANGCERVAVGTSIQQAACRALMCRALMYSAHEGNAFVDVPESLVDKIDSLPVGVQS